MSTKPTITELPQLPQLPNLPTLTGEETYEAWHDALISHLAFHDLDDIVLGDQEPPIHTSSPEAQMHFKMKQILAYTMIATSIKPIMSTLEAMGFIDNKTKYPIPDPRPLFNAVRQWYSDISAEHKFRLVKELTEIRHSDFPNLHAFLDRALWLRRRLQRASFDVPDELMDMLLLKGLGSYDDVWVKMILHNKNTGCLTEDVASLIAKKASEQKVIKDTPKDILPIKTTEEKGAEAIIKTHEEKSAHAEPTKSVHSATSILDEDIPAEADNLKTLKPSPIATPAKDNTTVNGSSIIDSSNENKLSTTTDTDSSPQSGTNPSSKTPITNITTLSPTPVGTRQGQKTPFAFSTQPFNKNAYRPTVSAQPFNPLAYRPAVTVQRFNLLAYRPSNMKPSSSVANIGNQTGNTPQHVSCFGSRPVVSNTDIGPQNATQKGPQQGPQNAPAPRPISYNNGPLNAAQKGPQQGLQNGPLPISNANSGRLNATQNFSPPAINGNNAPQSSGQNAALNIAPTAARPLVNGNNGAKIGPQNGAKPANGASIWAAFIASRNKHIYTWLDGIDTDETAWLDPNLAEEEQSMASEKPSIFGKIQYAESISPMSSLSVNHFPIAVKQQYAALHAAAGQRKPKPHDIPDWVGGLDPKERAGWFERAGPHTFGSYWVEMEERNPFLRMTRKELGPNDPRRW